MDANDFLKLKKEQTHWHTLITEAKAVHIYPLLSKAKKEAKKTAKKHATRNRTLELDEAVVAHRRNNKEWIIIMDANDFMTLVKK